eukprot:gene5038-6139_t
MGSSYQGRGGRYNTNTSSDTFGPNYRTDKSHFERSRPQATHSTQRNSSGRPVSSPDLKRKPRAPTQPAVDSEAEERADLAEKLSLELAQRLRDAETRAESAEQEKARLQGTLAGIRSHLCRKFGLEHGSVQDGKDRYDGFLRLETPSFWGMCEYGNGDVYEGEWLDGMQVERISRGAGIKTTDKGKDPTAVVRNEC